MQTQHTTEIKYDRKSKDYAVIVDMNVIGFARNYHEGEILASNYIGELETLNASAPQIEEPTYTVTYNDETDKYDVEMNGDWIGSRPTYTQALDFGDEQLHLLAADNEPALPQPVQTFLDTLDDTPALPAVFSATSAEPLDAMLQALEQAAGLIARLGDEVISQTDEVTISVCGQPLTTVVVVVAPRVAAVEAAPIRTQEAA